MTALDMCLYFFKSVLIIYVKADQSVFLQPDIQVYSQELMRFNGGVGRTETNHNDHEVCTRHPDTCR